MAALQHLPVIHLLRPRQASTVGEDGPTHQPIEMLSMLRATPNTLVLRPADGDETISCWALALNNRTGPSVLVLSRIPLPRLDRSSQVGDAARGGYIVRSAAGGAPAVSIVASGSEVSLAVQAAALLDERGVPAQVVSMPSQEVFFAQDADYRELILAPGLPRLAVEAGHPQSLWRIVDGLGEVYGIEKFGASAPPERICCASTVSHQIRSRMPPSAWARVAPRPHAARGPLLIVTESTDRPGPSTWRVWTCCRWGGWASTCTR